MKSGRSAKSQLFTLRVWMEDVGNGSPHSPTISSRRGGSRYELRGTLKHVLTGETYHFRDWQTMIRYAEAVIIPDGPQVESRK